MSTQPVEPLPDLPPPTGLPSAWEPCPLCGALTPAPATHRAWHQQIVSRVRAAEDILAAARAQLKDARDRITALEQRSTP